VVHGHAHAVLEALGSQTAEKGDGERLFGDPALAKPFDGFWARRSVRAGNVDRLRDGSSHLISISMSFERRFR
jgi:hypothetical protein